MERWLAAPSASPQFESEALVRFFFADLGTREDALKALDELIAHAQAQIDAFRAITASYANSPGPFRERLHIGSLIGRFLLDHSRTIEAWARWAKSHVEDWPDTGSGAAALGEAVQEQNERLAGVV